MPIKQQNTAPFDADAQRFILAAGISNKIQRRAINYLVQGLKANNLWTKCNAIYPMVGGIAASHKFNLKDPRDSDIAFRLTFLNSPTHSSRGVDWNGTNQYANTNLSNIDVNSASVQYYSTENIAGANSCEIGVAGGGGSYYLVRLIIKWSDGNSYLSISNSNVYDNGGNIVSNTAGLFTLTRTASNALAFYRNGTSIFTSATASSAIVQNPIRLASDGDYFSSKNCAFASIGSGLTATEANLFYKVVQQFQIILQRNV